MISFAKAKKNVPKGSKATLTIATFEGGLSGEVTENILPMRKAKYAVNFNYSNGALKNGIGFSPLSCNLLEDEDRQLLIQNIKDIGKVVRAWHFKKLDPDGNRKDKLLFLSEDKRLFSASLAGDTKEVADLEVQFSSLPVAVNYNLDSEDVIIFCSATDPMIVWNGQDAPYSVADSPAITSMVIHYERLFATSAGAEQNSVWFSDDLDPTNWTLSLDAAGFIQMVDEKGASNKVVSFLDYVYVFRDFGISRISAYGSQNEFLVSQLFTTSGKIYPQTVTLCGDEILFLAEDGIYSFNGLETRKILQNISPFFNGISNENAVATACNGKWYLSCRMHFFEHKAKPENVLMELDTKTREFSLCTGVNIVHLSTFHLPYGSFAVACVQNENKSKIVTIDNSGKDQNTVLKGEWITPLTDLKLGTKVKIIRKVTLSTKSEITVIIKTETQEKTLVFEGKLGTNSKKVHISGKKVQFTIKNENEDCEVSNLQIELFTEVK